jgi:LysM repeat protein
MRFKLVIAFLVLSFAASAIEVDSLRSEKKGDQWFVIHQVDQGETLYAIARRYKADVNQIINQNNIIGNNLQVGQVLEIPISAPRSTASTPKTGKTHVVKAGETLFAVARKYEVKVDEIVAWNSLASESLSIGQELRIGSSVGSSYVAEKPKEVNNVPTTPFNRAQKHYVQTGETVFTIADHRKVSIDSIRAWNKLTSDDLKIGQILWYRTYYQAGDAPIRRDVFGKKIEEGIAMQIENMDDTDKYLALHKDLPIGSLIEIRNLMNNKKVYVRVVGQLPKTGINEKVIVRLTSRSFKQLGILDARARVEIVYYEE